MAAPATISTSAEAGTGLKKCRPRNRVGHAQLAREIVDRDRGGVRCQRRGVGEHSFDTGEGVELERAILGNGLDDEVAAGERRDVDAAPGAPARARRATRRCVPRCTDRARLSRMRAAAASADGSSRSTTVTRLPASRNACAMPAPIRPPPSTPTWAGAPLCDALIGASSPGTRSCGASSPGSRTARPAARARCAGCASAGASSAVLV